MIIRQFPKLMSDSREGVGVVAGTFYSFGICGLSYGMFLLVGLEGGGSDE